MDKEFKELDLDAMVEDAKDKEGVKGIYRPMSNNSLYLDVDDTLLGIVKEFVNNYGLEGYSRNDRGNTIYIKKNPNRFAALFARLIGTNPNIVFSIDEVSRVKAFRLDFYDLSDPLVKAIYENTIRPLRYKE